MVEAYNAKAKIEVMVFPTEHGAMSFPHGSIKTDIGSAKESRNFKDIDKPLQK
jgi:hypothetical protein